MMQTNQRPQDTASAAPASPQGFLTSPSYIIRPTADAISDNDTSEKPVREKLKKTSLASMSSHVGGRRERAFQATEENSVLEYVHRDSSPEKDTDQKGVKSRGRPVKKRSFDNLATPEVEIIEAGRDQGAKSNSNGHLRKRSRDVRAGDVPHERRPLLPGTPVREEIEGDADGSETDDNFVECPKSAVDSKSLPIETLPRAEMEEDKTLQGDTELEQPIAGKVQEHHVNETRKGFADQEMRDSASSPQKKRSRDQFDTEADREQKIPATEEARAHRRSDELERGDDSITRSQSPISTKGSMVVGQQATLEEGKDEGMGSHSEARKQERPFGNLFGSVSTFSTSAFFDRSNSSDRVSTSAIKMTDQASQNSADAFASSGFAALAASSTSPFGTLGGSLAAGIGGPLGSVGAFNPEKAETEKTAAQNPHLAASKAFGTFASTTSASFSSTNQSPFGTSGVSKTGGFGSSVFGSAFGGQLGGGNRLANFAAPAGSANLGVSKPLGSPKREQGKIESSDSEGEGSAEKKKDEEDNEADCRFQHQDVETGEGGEDSIFCSRASLYSFRDNAWKESGKGTFKLNITTMLPEDDSSAQKTGRFIMRAHQTYRVLLNVPVFKQMQVGDSRGDEPSGKSFLFAVIEHSKPVVHMLKLGDVMDSKTLYHEVRRLQRGLE